MTNLADYVNVDGNILHTTKVVISNDEDRRLLVYLRNDSTITGQSSKDWSWTNPLQFIGEYGSTLAFDPQDYVPPIFSTWFKAIDPGETFVIYFQYDAFIDVEKLKSLIRVRNAIDHNGVEDLGWKDDEIVIPLRPNK